MNHLIVTYSLECAEKGHIDPNFTMLTYGDSDIKGKKIQDNLEVGSYIFFNTRIGDSRYITGYYYVEKILSKYKGQENEINNLNCHAKYDDVVVIGSRDKSKILTCPLLLDKSLVKRLESFDADENYFASKKSDLEAIKDKTLNHRILSEEDKEVLMNLCKNRG